MGDWTEFLQDLSGGAAGIVSGLTAGAKPFDAWEGVRTKDIANDRGEINNRDLELIQWARENPDIDYYGNKIGAEDTGYRQKMASGEVDIFGNEQKLALAQYLADPNGAFQQGVDQAGLTPGTPEYREWLSEAMSMYDPSGAVGAYDKMGIPGIQNRNMNEQTSIQFAQNFIRANSHDPNAVIVRKADGTFAVMSNGEETDLPGDVMLKMASMMNAKDPYGAVSAGMKDEMGIQDSNTKRVTAQAAVIKAMQEGRITPAAAAKYYQEQRVSANQILVAAQKEMQQIANEAKTSMWTAEETEARMAPARENVKAAQRTMQETQQMLQRILATGRVPGMAMGGGPAGSAGPRVAPQGGTSVTTRPQRGALAARAAGGGPGAGAMPPWGRSAEGPGYGRADNSGATLSSDDLQMFLQQQGLL